MFGSELSSTLGSGYDYYNAHSGSGNRYVACAALVYGLLMLSFFEALTMTPYGQG